MRRVVWLLLALALLAGPLGCGGGDGAGDDAFARYAGTWTGSFTSKTGSAGSLTLVVDGDGDIDLDVTTEQGGYIVARGVDPVWDGDSFSYSGVPENALGIWSIDATFSGEAEGTFELDGPMDWTPCSGTMTRQPQ
jgi:hypothetical protein